MRHIVLSLALIAVCPIVTLTAEEGRQAQGERSGSIKGQVIAVDAKGNQFTIRSPQGEFSYAPRWVGGMPKDGGGPDAEMVNRIRQLSVNDYVMVNWEKDEHLRVVQLAILGKPEHREEAAKPREGEHREEPARPREGEHHEEPGKPNNEAAAYLDGPGPAERCGTLRGTVQSVDPKGRFVIKTPTGTEETFMPQWRGGMPDNGGGFNKEIVGKIAQLKTGQQVEVNWEWNERKRCVSIRPAN